MRALAYRWFGFLSLDKADGLRFTWMQICFGLGIGAKLTLNRDDSDRWRWGIYLHLLLFKLYLKLWRSRKDWPNPSHSHHLWWGFDWSSEWHSCFWFGWPGKKQTLYHLPWSWKHYGTWNMGVDGSPIPESRPRLGKPYLHWRDNPDIKKEQHPYTYKLKNGGEQHVIATVCQTTTVWRWKIGFGPAKIRHYLEIEFSDEVGERAGSWKGGCTGCSWDLLDPNEPWNVALKRMEMERKF